MKLRYLIAALIVLAAAPVSALILGPSGSSSIIYVPNAPTISSVSTASATSLSLIWSYGAADSGHNAGTSVNVYRGTSAGGESGTAVATGITSSPWTDTGLTTGTTYYYKLLAANSAGNSATYSNEASGTPTATTTGLVTGWHASTAGVGTATVNGDSTVTISENAGTSGAAAIYYHDGVTKAQSATYKMQFTAPSNTTGGEIISFGDSTPSVGTISATTGAWHKQCGVYLWTSGANIYARASAGNGTTTAVWTQRTNGWVSDGSIQWSTDGAYSVTPNTIYTIVAQTTTTGVSFAFKSSDETTTYFQTTELPWSTYKSTVTTMYPWAGDPYTDAGYGTLITLKSFSIQ